MRVTEVEWERLLRAAEEERFLLGGDGERERLLRGTDGERLLREAEGERERLL